MAAAEGECDDSSVLAVPGDDAAQTSRDATWRRLEETGRAMAAALVPGGSVAIALSTPDRSRALVVRGAHLLHDARSYASWQLAGQSSAVHSRASTIAELRGEGLVRVLTPDECIARAKERGPFCDFVHFPLCGGLPPERGWESLELYASEVLPRLA
jgi:hypothetical protein